MTSVHAACLIIGFALGILVSTVIFLVLYWSRKPDGVLEVDSSDETKTKWIFRYDGDPDRIKEKKTIVLEVR